MDAFHGRHERAVVVTNDSDLLEPIRMARSDLGVKSVGANYQTEERRSSASVDGEVMWSCPVAGEGWP
jgi:hypothetical protein